MTSTELVPIEHHVPAPPAARLLAVDVAAYLLNKKKRLTAKSEISYTLYLRRFVNHFPDHTLAMFEPPTGSLILEDFLNQNWGERAPATYNKGHSVLSDFFSWHVKRMNLMRDPMLVIERAKRRQYHRTTFSEAQCVAILTSNPYPRAQIALRLLLFYGIRKGALQTVRFQDFNRERHELTIFTKGEKIQKIQLVGDVIWDLLDEIDGEPTHYLVPRQVQRRRKPPHRKQLKRLEAIFDEASGLIAAVREDAQAEREADAIAAQLRKTREWLDRAIEATSVKVTFFHDEEIGEHALHNLWYRWLARAGIVAKGVTRGQRMHGARHASAQRVLDKTGNIKAAQALLGHSSSAVTEAYTEFSDDALGDAMGTVLGGVEAGLSQALTDRAKSRSRGGSSRA
jgi:integrase